MMCPKTKLGASTSNPNWPSLVNMIYSLEMSDNDSKRTRPHTQNTTQNCREYHSTEDPEDWTYLNRRNIIKWIMQTFPSLFQSSRQFSVSPFSYLRNINQGVKLWIFYCWCFTRGFQKMKRIFFFWIIDNTHWKLFGSRSSSFRKSAVSLLTSRQICRHWKY